MAYHNNNNTLNVQNKEKLKKAAKEKTKLTYKGKQSDFSMETENLEQ